jgi:hypothetical protein
MNLPSEKMLPSGEECTLIEDNGQWTVDMWDAQGEHRWAKTYNEYADAKREYDRWN